MDLPIFKIKALLYEVVLRIHSKYINSPRSCHAYKEIISAFPSSNAVVKILWVRVCLFVLSLH